ncbi:hypothetical protein ACLBKS_02705 [Hylemonella sp. W303a]|uniref:hypothetical protein n=1 Tax=Hylemonella sp. W303a TaxID=3389873 RepID=UPI00396AF0A3
MDEIKRDAEDVEWVLLCRAECDCVKAAVIDTEGAFIRAIPSSVSTVKSIQQLASPGASV